MTYPSTLKLMQALYSFLSTHVDLALVCDVQPTHPRLSSDLPQGKGRIVLSEIRDELKGKWVSQKESRPHIQIACYGVTEAKSRQVQELVCGVLESRKITDLSMAGQLVQYTQLDQWFPPKFSETAALHLSAVVYCFYLSLMD